jgi:hypothetical protein
VPFKSGHGMGLNISSTKTSAPLIMASKNLSRWVGINYKDKSFFFFFFFKYIYIG